MAQEQEQHESEVLGKVGPTLVQAQQAQNQAAG